MISIVFKEPIGTDSEVLIVDNDGSYQPIIQRGEQVVWSGAIAPSIEAAKSASIAYHAQKVSEIRDGWVGSIIWLDPDSLEFHPYNKLLYLQKKEVERNKALKALLDVEKPHIDPLTITPSLTVVSGNRRLATIREINQDCEKQGLPRKFPAVPVMIKLYSDRSEELRGLALANQHRQDKTRFEILNEAIFLLGSAQELARSRKSLASASKSGSLSREQKEEIRTGLAQRGRATEQVVEEIQKQNPNVKLNTKTLDYYPRINEAINSCESEELKEQWVELYDVSDSAPLKLYKHQQESDAGEDELLAIAKLINNEKLTPDRAIAQVVSAKKSLASSSSDSNQLKTFLDRTYELRNDPLRQEFKTHPNVIELALGACEVREFDCDVFADLEKSVPARNHITIAHGNHALSPSANWQGMCFVSVLPDRPWDCIAELDRQIKRGNLTKCVAIAPASVLFDSRCQDVFEKREVSLCMISPKKLGDVDGFDAETPLYKYASTVTSKKVRKDDSALVAIFWSINNTGWLAFRENFSGIGMVTELTNRDVQPEGSSDTWVGGMSTYTNKAGATFRLAIAKTDQGWQMSVDGQPLPELMATEQMAKDYFPLLLEEETEDEGSQPIADGDRKEVESAVSISAAIGKEGFLDSIEF